MILPVMPEEKSKTGRNYISLNCDFYASSDHAFYFSITFVVVFNIFTLKLILKPTFYLSY